MGLEDMRSSFTSILITMILVVPSLFFMSYLSGGEETVKPSQQTAVSFSTISYDGLELKVRATSSEDVEFMKMNEGTASQNSNFNTLINGSGTGLKPPTAEEWNEIGNSFQIIEDISFASPAALNTSKLHNQSIHFPPIGNQGAEGSCVSWSIGYYTKTWHEAKENDWNLSGASMVGTWPGEPSSGYQDKIMSPDFVYHQTNDGLDTGSYYRDAIYLTQSTGICTWEEMPYDCYNHTSWPSEDAWREAPLYRSEENSTYMMFTQTNATITDLKTWIDAGNLATISINANRYSSLSNELWNNTVECGTGRNHANTIIGYDDNFGPYQEDGTSTSGAFLVANSWGKGWTGDSNSDGMYWISYECMRKKVQYVFLMADRIGYEPKALALFNISHNIRDECTMTLGIGSRSTPLDTKEMFDNAFFDGGAHPFPSNMIAFDITEFNGSVSSFIGRNFFLRVDDGGTTTTGSIQDFSIELYDDYSSGPSKRFASDDPVVNTINSGTVYAEVTATDETPPRFIEDRTNDNATTGDPLTFSVVIEDNGLMDEVFVEYWNGTGPVSNTSMVKGTGDTWSLTISAPHTLDNITYRFHANDTGDNWNETTSKDIEMVDNDLPMIAPTMPATATTGDPFDIIARVTDNIEVDDVVLEHWYDEEMHSNSTMSWSSLENWTETLTIEDRLGTLHLIFKANDTSENLGASIQYNISVRDNDLPTFIEDLSDTSSTTGDDFLFSLNITDNVGISSASVEYSNGDGFSGNTSMTSVSAKIWELYIPAPDSTEDIDYMFHFNDTSDNWNNSATDSLTVTDNDSPTFGADTSPSFGTTGDSYGFRITINDNIQIQNVYLDYWFGTGTHQNVSMSGSGPYSYQIVIPADSTDTLHYKVHAVDTSSNWNETPQVDIPVLDNDLPSLWMDNSPSTATTGETFTFELTVVDNIGIGSVYVECWFGTGAHSNFSMTGSGPYSYMISIPFDSIDALHYIFRAMDTSLNWNDTSQVDITVFDNDKPYIWTDSSPTTSTTGDPYTFDLDVMDNIGIDSVSVEYWFGSSAHNNQTMSDSGTYTLTIIMPSYRKDGLHYIFHAGDTSGNWNFTSRIDVPILDNDAPDQWYDLSTQNATTGDPYEFNLTVFDNIGIGSVHVEYWLGSGEHINSTMVGPDFNTYTIVMPWNSTDTLHYIFHARDTSDNWNSTLQTDVAVEDNDIPIIVSDPTSTNGYTADTFSFAVIVSDNIEVASVHVEYWYGSGPHENETMSGTKYCYYNIEIPSNSTETLHYIFHFRDTSNNWNSTLTSDVMIIDDDKPSIFDDDTMSTGTTGDEFVFNVALVDNTGISEVWLEYWFGEGEHQNVSMERNISFVYTITIPTDSVDDLVYIIHFCDETGNWNRSYVKNVTIMDNDPPEFGMISYTEQLNTGDNYSISAQITDNIGMGNVTLEYWFGEDIDHNTIEMSLEGSKYIGWIQIPVDSTEDLHYVIIATDTSGLTIYPWITNVSVTDNILPEISPVDDIVIYEGSHISVSIHASDNIGIESYSWSGVPIEITGPVLTMNATESGTMDVSVSVFDPSGNKISVDFRITVLAADHDSDEDGIPDIVEEENGLDMNDSSDASEDNDDDGLTNLEEYIHGTRMDSGDSDEDGMPDKWEIDNELDPMTYSSSNDEDEDGKTDLEEYTEGTNPLVSDASDSDFDLLIPIIILATIVAAIILVVVLFIVIKKVKSRKSDIKEEEVMKWD